MKDNKNYIGLLIRGTAVGTCCVALAVIFEWVHIGGDKEIDLAIAGLLLSTVCSCSMLYLLKKEDNQW